jgi:hypothetical protein
LFPVEVSMASKRADFMFIGSSRPLVTTYYMFFVFTCNWCRIKDKSVYVERRFTFIARAVGNVSDL